MVLNQETAMRLWHNQFGDATRVLDFADREIDKGAYNDRNSKYGWNVDHILPESKGGKTTDSNLICCHIKTNDEKADKFPCFVANGIKFEIVKVQNHYEIKRVGEVESIQNSQPPVSTSPSINFMDSAAGVRIFKELEKKSSSDLFVASIIVRFCCKNKAPIIEFIKKLIGDSFSYSFNESGSAQLKHIEIIAYQYDVDTKEKTALIIQKCIMLNTYLKYYFEEAGYISDFDIYYREDCYDRYDNSLEDKIYRNLKKNVIGSYRHTLFLNSLVIKNNEIASERVGQVYYDNYYEYDYIYTQLRNNLLKEVKG